MFIAGHAAAGALIGQQLGDNLLLVFLLSVISHFLLDIVPHGDSHHVKNYFENKKEEVKKLYNVLLVDSAATIILFSWLMAYTNVNRMAVAWGVIGGVLPDLLVGISEIWKNSKLKWFSKLHFKVHNALTHKIDVKPLTGAIGQLVVIALLLYAL